MVETNDEERQQKYEDKISLRTLLLHDIERINKALLSNTRSGISELENLLSDLPEDIYRSVVPEMNKFTERFNESVDSLEEDYNVAYNRDVRVSPRDGTRQRRKADLDRWYAVEFLKLQKRYVRECKKLIRWTMDDFGLGLEEEGRRIDEGGLK